MARMQNAPIYFALVQVRFNALLTLETYIPAIQDVLRKTGYADFSKNVMATINLNFGAPGVAAQMPMAQPLALFQFLNDTKTAGFILHQTAMSFQATQYETFEHFSEVFLKGLKTVDESVGGLTFSERIGTRFLDAICPRAGEKLSDYMAPSLIGLSEKLNGRKLTHAVSETWSTLNRTNLMCRAIVKEQENGGVEFPPDLQPNPLVVQEKFRSITGRYGILDTDSWSEDRQKFSSESISKTLKELHVEARRSFDDMVTQHALAVWQ